MISALKSNTKYSESVERGPIKGWDRERERREMSGKGWVAKRYLFLFTWNRPFSILEKGNKIWSPVVLL